MNKLKPLRKAQLLKALRTPPEEGGYYQTQGALYARIEEQDTVYDPHTDEWVDTVLDEHDSFCCLGVATNLAVLAGVCSWEDVVLPYKDAHGEVDTNYSDVYVHDAYSKAEAEDYVKGQGGKKSGLQIVLSPRGPGSLETRYYVYKETYTTAGLPGAQVMSWFGFDPESATALAVWNDGGKSFLEIADLIDKRL